MDFKKKNINSNIISTIIPFFNNYEKGDVKFTIQDENKAPNTSKRSPEDGEIDWNKDSTEIHNLIRALAYPYPGAFFLWKGKKYFIRRAILGPN